MAGHRLGPRVRWIAFASHCGADRVGTAGGIGIRVEEAVADARDHNATKPVWVLRCGVQQRHRAQGKADRIDWVGGEGLHDPGAEVVVRLWLVRLGGGAVTQEVDADHVGPADIAEEHVPPGTLPGGGVRATPAVNEDNRSSHAGRLATGPKDHPLTNVGGQTGRVQTVRVPLPDGRDYEAHVGAGVRHELARAVAATTAKAKRAAIVAEASLVETLGIGELDPGIEHRVFTVPEGEDTKTLATVESLCSSFASWGMNRNDVVIAVGGGRVTDLGGFTASCYHRGIATIYVSTTLLGMIDAAIGGKTGVNLPEGKNLVGSYWQPSAVLCDTDFFATMPAREYRSGLGEMAKYHFLTDKPGELDQASIEDRIAACIRIKADVVASDEREGGRRAILNYGHTLGHAIEIATGFSVMHGEAVAMGLIYAAELGHRLGRIDGAKVSDHRRVVASYDLATSIPSDLRADDLVELMGRDKKALDGLTFVLDGPNGVESVVGVDHDVVLEALEAVR
jgi:5-deoxy-5-amino-3-dehydroquinate synthase